MLELFNRIGLPNMISIGLRQDLTRCSEPESSGAGLRYTFDWSRHRTKEVDPNLYSYSSGSFIRLAFMGSGPGQGIVSGAPHHSPALYKQECTLWPIVQRALQHKMSNMLDLGICCPSVLDEVIRDRIWIDRWMYISLLSALLPPMFLYSLT